MPNPNQNPTHGQYESQKGQESQFDPKRTQARPEGSQSDSQNRDKKQSGN